MGRPSAKACHPCGVAKARCSFADVAPSVAGSIADPDIEIVAPPRARNRGAASDAQLRIAKAAEDSALHHKRSADALVRVAEASERAAAAFEGLNEKIAGLTLAISGPRATGGQYRGGDRPAIPGPSSRTPRASASAASSGTGRTRKRSRTEALTAESEVADVDGDGDGDEEME